jgi:hypothetical protein
MSQDIEVFSEECSEKTKKIAASVSQLLLLAGFNYGGRKK